jgi:hypothetical protein
MNNARESFHANDDFDDYVWFALGFRTASYGVMTLKSSDHAFVAGKEAGREFYPARVNVPGEIVRAAYEKWKDGSK